MHYTITVANSGLTTYSGATLTAGLGGVLDDASYNHDAAATAGTVTFTSPSLTWTGDVPASGTVTITYSVTVNSPDTGNHILASTITSASTGSNCGTGSADPRCTATVHVAVTAHHRHRRRVHRHAPAPTCTTRSPPPTPARPPTRTPASPLTMPAPSEDATYNGDLAATSGTITVDSTAQTATWTGDLAVGASVTITYSVTVIRPDTDPPTPPSP